MVPSANTNKYQGKVCNKSDKGGGTVELQMLERLNKFAMEEGSNRKLVIVHSLRQYARTLTWSTT